MEVWGAEHLPTSTGATEVAVVAQVPQSRLILLSALNQCLALIVPLSYITDLLGVLVVETVIGQGIGR